MPIQSGSIDEEHARKIVQELQNPPLTIYSREVTDDFSEYYILYTENRNRLLQWVSSRNRQ